MRRYLIVGVGALLGTLLLATGIAAMSPPSGRPLYEQKCAICHGKDGVAKPPGKGSKNFNDPAFQSAWDAEAIAKVTAEGRGKMPAYRSTLRPEEIAAIAAHVKTLGK
jgi:mono/diheme cytochrome c family protein